jgi:hypothetical protein
MEPSPLTQDSRPHQFQPKIIRLYETLFQDDDDTDTGLSDGFWQEFFLHRTDAAGLKRILASMAPDDMLHVQAHSQQLVGRAVQRIKQGAPPADEVALEVRRRRHMVQLQTQAYEPDLDRLPRCRPRQEVHQSQLRHHLGARGAARRRRRHDRLHRYAGHGDAPWQEQ